MAVLVVNSGSLRGRRFEVGPEGVTIGRAPDNTVSIDDPSVSGHHCAVIRADGKYTLRDLASTNGTAVNGDLVREQRLRAGDMLTVGTVLVAFEGEDVDASDLPPRAAPAAPSRPATVRSAPIGDAQPFGARRDRSKRVWSAVILLVIVLVAAAAGWFVARLFR